MSVHACGEEGQWGTYLAGGNPRKRLIARKQPMSSLDDVWSCRVNKEMPVKHNPIVLSIVKPSRLLCVLGGCAARLGMRRSFLFAAVVCCAVCCEQDRRRQSSASARCSSGDGGATLHNHQIPSKRDSRHRYNNEGGHALMLGVASMESQGATHATTQYYCMRFIKVQCTVGTTFLRSDLAVLARDVAFLFLPLLQRLGVHLLLWTDSRSIRVPTPCPLCANGQSVCLGRRWGWGICGPGRLSRKSYHFGVQKVSLWLVCCRRLQHMFSPSEPVHCVTCHSSRFRVSPPFCCCWQPE